MTRLIDHHCDVGTLDPLTEAVALLDLTELGQFQIVTLSPPAKSRKARPARMDRDPDAIAWLSMAGCCR